MNKNLSSAIYGALLSIGVSALGYFFLDRSDLEKFLPDSKGETAIYFSMLIIAPLSALVVHELGHLLTGIALGQKLKLFVVAFLGIRENEGRIEFFFNKNISHFGGVAATAPKTISEIKHQTFAKILIAGPIFSILYAVICGAIFFQFDNYFNSFFALSSLTSFGLFLATTVPDKSGMMFTDRKRFQRLNTKGATQDAEVTLYQMISFALIENSFRNIDVKKTEILDRDSEITTKFWAEYLRFMFYKDNGMMDQKNRSAQALLNFKSEIPKSIWRTLEVE